MQRRGAGGGLYVTRREVLATARRLAGAAMVPGLATVLGGCPGLAPAPQGNGPDSAPRGNSVRLEFWHTRRGGQEKALQAICADYQAATPGVTLEPVYQGNYDALNRKVRAAIQARALPALTVAYESHVTEYMASEVVLPLDALVKDPELGFTAEELADIPELYLESNRFAQFGGQLLSFPFTKSNLVMYYNQSLLERAGYTAPPQTWDDFEKQAAAVTRLNGKPAYACSVDASTIDGMIFSFGGDVIDSTGRVTLFDQPPAIQAFSVLGRMARARTLVEATGDDTGGLFSGQACAFALDSSSGRRGMEELVGEKFRWDVGIIPHGAGVAPATVMYGPNIVIFKANPEQERAAWRFVKYFVSPEVTARWARETGYLPVRRSAVELPEMKKFYAENPRAWNVYEVLKAARGEPNVLGWQEVRSAIEATARAVIAGGDPAAEARKLKARADQILTQSR
jgi:multiple sugar transport system substrate-binding protein